MEQKVSSKKIFYRIVVLLAMVVASFGCAKKEKPGFSKEAASKVYVPPGSHDEMYAFMSGGFSGQVSVYGIPSGRLFKVISVFSQNPETGYGYSEETKGMLNTSYGFVPWDDAHHPEFSQTNGCRTAGGCSSTPTTPRASHAWTCVTWRPPRSWRSRTRPATTALPSPP